MKSMLEVLQTIPVYPEEITKRALFGQYVQDYRLPCDALLCEDGPWLSWISREAKEDFLVKAERKSRLRGVDKKNISSCEEEIRSAMT